MMKLIRLPPTQTSAPVLTFPVIVAIDVKGIEKLVVIMSHEVHSPGT